MPNHDIELNQGTRKPLAFMGVILGFIAGLGLSHLTRHEGTIAFGVLIFPLIGAVAPYVSKQIGGFVLLGYVLIIAAAAGVFE